MRTCPFPPVMVAVTVNVPAEEDETLYTAVATEPPSTVPLEEPEERETLPMPLTDMEYVVDSSPVL